MADIINKFKKEKILKYMRQTKLVLLLFVLSLALILGIPITRGSFVVAGRTRINFEYNGHRTHFVTSKTSLIEAVREQGVNVNDQDLFDPPRETVLSGGRLEVRVIKSWPVIISDNGQKLHGRTVYKEPDRILAQNKIRTWPEDIIRTELILNPVEAGGAGEMISIRRAPVYKVAVDGKLREVRTWDRNVKKIIEESATKLNPNDIVSPAVSESVSNGSVINITRINYADIAEMESIPYKTVYQGSTSLAFGTIKAIINGITGTKKNTYRVTYKDGDEISRRLTGATIVRAKRDAKILRGALTGTCKWGPYYETNYGPYTTAFHYAKKEHNPAWIGHYILVTNLANRRSVKVKVVDAGPTDGILDLSTTAMREIGGANVTFFGRIDNVRVELLD